MAGVPTGRHGTYAEPAEEGKLKAKRAAAELQATADEPGGATIGTARAEEPDGTATIERSPGAPKATEGARRRTGECALAESDREKLKCFWEAYGVVKDSMTSELSNMSVVTALLATLTFGLVVSSEPLQLYSPVLTVFFHAFIAASLIMSLYQLSLALRTTWLFNSAMTPLYVFKALVHYEYWCHESYGAFKWSLRPLVVAVGTWMLDVVVRAVNTDYSNYLMLPAAIVGLMALVAGPVMFVAKNSLLDANLRPSYVHIELEMGDSREATILARLRFLMLDVNRALSSGDSLASASTTNRIFEAAWQDLVWSMDNNITWTDMHPSLAWLDRVPIIYAVVQMLGATWWWQRFAIKKRSHDEAKPQLAQ